MLTLTVMIGLLVQDVLGYSALTGRRQLHPVRHRVRRRQRPGRPRGPHVPPRWLIIGGGAFVLAAMLFGSTLTRTIPYFPTCSPIVIGGFGIRVIR